MNDKPSLIQPEQIEQVILRIRGQRVLLDRDLAALYGVTTGNLNKAVQRNAERFPPDFMFQLTADEAKALRFHFGSLKRGLHFKYLPRVFTQEGVAMLSSVLRSPRAVQVNIAIRHVFVRLRASLALHKDLAHKLTELERKIEGHDKHPHAVRRHSRTRGPTRKTETRDRFSHQGKQRAIPREAKMTIAATTQALTDTRDPQNLRQ